MRYNRIILFFVSLFIAVIPTNCQETITAYDAKNHIGEIKTVCGMVASTNYAYLSKGKPTFLNLEKPYPDQVFTVVIWQDVRKKFSTKPEVFYKNKSICFTGRISEYRKRPQIELKRPNEIEIN